MWDTMTRLGTGQFLSTAGRFSGRASIIFFLLFLTFAWAAEVKPLYTGKYTRQHYTVQGETGQGRRPAPGSDRIQRTRGEFDRERRLAGVSPKDDISTGGWAAPSFLYVRGTSSVLSMFSRSRGRAAGGMDRLLSLTSGQHARWMTVQDEAGQRALSQAVLGLPTESLQQVLSKEPLRIFDKVVPPDSIFVVESGDAVDSFEPLRLQRKEYLGSGSRNVVVAAIKPRQDEAPAAWHLMRLGTVVPRSEKMIRVVQGLAAKEEAKLSPAKHGQHKAQAGSHLSDLERVAVRVAVSTWPPVRTEGEAASLVEERKSAQKKLRDILPSGISAADLETRFGFIVPRHTGRLAGKPGLLGSTGQTAVLNVIEVMKPLSCDLYTILSRVQDRQVNEFMVKRLIQLGAFLEAANLVHRDIKLENILLDARGQLYLTDFDAVVQAGEPLRCDDHPSVGYAPPEVLSCVLNTSGKDVLASPKSDAWSFGWLVWEILCRNRPFELPEPNPDDIRNLEVLESLGSLKERNTRQLDWSRCRSEVGTDLRELVEGLLDRNPLTRSSLVDVFTKHAVFQQGRVLTPRAEAGTPV